MSNALLLITQQRQRRKNSRPRPQYVHACVIRRHMQQYVCVHIAAEDAGSSAGKVNWALCWVKAYSAQTKGPIKKKSLLLAAEKPNTERWCLPRSLRSAAWMITNGDFKRAHDSRSWVRLLPLRSKTGGETTLEDCELHADSRRCNLYRYSHTELYKAVVWDDFLPAERKEPVAKINVICGESDTK